MYPPIFGSSALGGSGGGKDPGRPINLPSGHALDTICKDVWGLILEYLQRNGWMAVRGTNRQLRGIVDSFFWQQAHFDRVLELRQRRADLLGSYEGYMVDLQHDYGPETAQLCQYLENVVRRAAQLEGLARFLAARPQGSGLIVTRPNDAISTYPGYGQAVQESMQLLRGNGHRIPTAAVLVLVIAVIAIFVALLLR
jgi:hypothetical protein